jgi:ribose 5-phosphate isomerase RpiB
VPPTKIGVILQHTCLQTKELIMDKLDQKIIELIMLGMTREAVAKQLAIPKDWVDVTMDQYRLEKK